MVTSTKSGNKVAGRGSKESSDSSTSVGVPPDLVQSVLESILPRAANRASIRKLLGSDILRASLKLTLASGNKSKDMGEVMAHLGNALSNVDIEDVDLKIEGKQGIVKPKMMHTSERISVYRHEHKPVMKIPDVYEELASFLGKWS